VLLCSVILEVDPQVIAQRVAMRSDSEGDIGGLAALGEQVRKSAWQWHQRYYVELL
jgi:hypothetical protein